MFEATHPFLFFDYFRVPYRLAPPGQGRWGPPGAPLDRFCGRLWTAPPADGEGPTLSWLHVDGADRSHKGVAVAGRFTLDGNPIFGHVVPDTTARQWLDDPRGWRPVDLISDATDRQVASVWLAADGSIFLPFDPGEVMRRFWSETYQTIGQKSIAARARSALVKVYYTVRPALPRPLQIALRRIFTRVQRISAFPRWPIEDTLHNLYEWLFERLAAFAGRPVPWLDLWPDGRDWALVLTHDVETSVGCRDLELLRGVERELGFTSSWDFVPLRYSVAGEVLDGLRAEGCEIGVHGLLHDGRDLGSWRLLSKRLPRMREYADRWGAVGFRAPATQRKWEWMPKLGFDYDTSYHDTAPYEPTPGGCCSYFPFFNEDMVELPITLPQDHTIFTILQQPDEAVWTRKADHVRRRRGMVLVLTHPDYADDPRLVGGYRRLLEELRDDPSAWRALPREVSAWWRRRAQSTLEQTQEGWAVRGPAAPDGGIRFARAGVPAMAGAGGLPRRAPGEA
jgi:hypothetical protein